MAEQPTEKDQIVEVLIEHQPGGVVNSKEGWVECSCEARLYLPSGLTFDGYAEMWDEEEKARAEHVADALLALLTPTTSPEKTTEENTQ